MPAARQSVLSAVVAGTLASVSFGIARADANPCASIADPNARLACYDRTYGTAGGNAAIAVPGAAAAGVPATQGGPTLPAPSGAPVPAPSTAPVPVIKSPEQQVQEFGLTEEAVRKQAEAALPKDEPRPEVVTAIESTVATVGRRPAGQLVLKLANGQVWTQIETDARVFVKVGDAVTIRKALLGSYTLSTAHGSFKVRRLQ